VHGARGAANGVELADHRRSSLRGFGESSRPGSGIRSILRRLSRSDTIRVASPRTANRSTVSCAARLGPAVERQHQPSGTGRTCCQLTVDTAHMRPAYDRQLEPRCAGILDETAHPGRVGAPSIELMST
jgi:hypothetical protein